MENNSMVVKMKLDKDARDMVFECPACQKKFHSVKALGGHKRVHVVKSNKRNHEAMEAPLLLEASPSPLAAAAVAVAVAEKPPSSFSCPICPLAFPSAKSLHGHMRKHSDRGWRGMNPPPPPPSSPPSLNYNNSSSSLGGGGESSNSHTHVCACGRAFTSPPPRGAEDGGEGGSGRNHKRGVTFDLNELPPPSSDDETN